MPRARGVVTWKRMVDGTEVVLAGEIDLTCRPRLNEMIAALTAEMPGDVHVDVTEVTFFSSEGLGFLARAARIVVDENQRVLMVHNPSRQIRRMVEFLGLQDRLTFAWAAPETVRDRARGGIPSPRDHA